MLSRRQFTASLAAASALAQSKPRPNILWLTTEDIGPALGCYGDKYSVTPTLDKLAERSVRYLHAWSNFPVCAPARTTIISGMYPPSNGAEHMRSMLPLPAEFKMFPCYLRDAGYYTTNNSKTDYNLRDTGKVWDESNNKAHWRNRKAGQPFFAVFNFLITHESQIRTRPHEWKHDPAEARVPAYHPDTPEVRKDWAQYYDNITTMDGMAANMLKELSEDGLGDDTIIFFYGDHGSGMPRSKRWPYNSGLQVPLIVHVPEKWKHLAPKDYKAGGESERLVSFVDLAPTVLSLTGVKPPDHMHGKAFMGEFEAKEREYIYGFRGRMDERVDLVRTVSDGRYVYIRNYMPHKIYGQHIAYMFETPTTQVWKKMYDAGKLNAAQKHFWEPKPPEELYDLQTDRDEVNNLAGSAKHQLALRRLREAQRKLALEIRDVGFLPEGEIHERSKGSTPHEMARDKAKYDVQRVMAAAETASNLKPDSAGPLLRMLERDPDSAVRYWGALGILMRGKAAVRGNLDDLRKALSDKSPYVRVVVAEALGRFGDDADVKRSLDVLVPLAPADKNGAFVSLAALNAIDSMGDRAAEARPAIAKIAWKDPAAHNRYASYGARLVEHISGVKIAAGE